MAAIPYVWGALIFFVFPGTAIPDDLNGVRPLLRAGNGDLSSFLPKESRLLTAPDAIEAFLSALEGQPPDWATVYGAGHHEPEHDERVFQLNRDRDAGRKGKEALRWLVTFVWSGQLSTYDPASGGFAVALGPDSIRTRWGTVRFKAEELPANLMAVPDAEARDRLLRRQASSPVEIQVLMTGRLIPEESIIYDFSHDEERQGVIMPVVRVEDIAYVLTRTIHEGFYCNRRHAAATSLAAGFARPSGRARHSVGQHPVQGCLPRGAPRARHCRLTDSPASTNVALIILRAVDLAWRLRGFVTNPHE